MAGRVIYQPEPPHRCNPGVAIRTGPIGYRHTIPPKAKDFPKGTVWRCDDCGQAWVSKGGKSPGPLSFVEWRRERPWERSRLEKREPPPPPPEPDVDESLITYLEDGKSS